MAISRTTLRTNLFNDVYRVINTKVIDPFERDKQWIFSSFPNTTVSTKFVGYPIIIIKKSDVEKDYPLLDNSWSDLRVPIRIIVYSTDNSVLDTLCDSVDSVITPANLPQFIFYDYSETTDSININGTVVHFRMMTYFVEVVRT